MKTDGSLSSQEIFVMNKREISEKNFMVGVVLYRLAKFLLSQHILAICNNWVCQYGLGWCVGWGEHHMWLGCCEAGPVFTSLLLASWLGGGGTSQTQHTTTHTACAEPVTRSPLLDSPRGAVDECMSQPITLCQHVQAVKASSQS